MTSEAFVHQPVLVAEVLAALIQNTKEPAVYVDCTVGLGGHTEAILRAAPKGHVLGIDRDADALALAKERLAVFCDRVQLYSASFRTLWTVMQRQGLSEVTGMLFDLGVSSMQLMSGQRGFSFALPGPLDMRMDRSLPRTAADLVNTLSEQDLSDMIYQYGEERMARRIAKAIIRYRSDEGPFTTTESLSRLVCRVVRRSFSRMRLHPATKTFQALRIAVNDELGELDEGLSQAISLLAVGGRLAVISFHSLEDRMVKQRFKAAALQGMRDPRSDVRVGRRFMPVYKKPVTPTALEIKHHPSARSAKLRVLERVA